MILALETASPICSVALQTDDAQVLEQRATGQGVHSKQMLVFVKKLLEEANAEVKDLKAVLISMGPGSFTGLRIATSAVKGLLFGRDIPVIGYPTLATMAASLMLEDSIFQGRVGCFLDARRQHLYAQFFNINGGTLTAENEAKTLEIEQIKTIIQSGDTLMGTGLNRLDVSQLNQSALRLLDTDMISAKGLISLYNLEQSNMDMNPYIKGVTFEVESFEPIYTLKEA